MTIMTTREIYVHLAKGQRKLERTTTKHVDASIKVVQPKIPQKPVTLSTAGLPDVSDIIDKKKRDDIMVQRKLYLKDQKKLAQNEKKKAKIVKKAFEKGDMIYQDKTGEVVVIEKPGQEIKVLPKGSHVDLTKDEKKPWDDLTEEERQVEMKKRLGGEEYLGDITEEEKKIVLRAKTKEIIAERKKQKPLKEMTQEEKKLAMKERMAKVRAGKDKKK